MVAAVPLYLVRARDQWFFQDEWDFLADRDGGSVHDLFRPHNEHWSTLPIIVYRVLWRFVGLRHYVVYQSLIVGLHLTAAVLLRVVMRRAGVGPWIASAAAAAFVLFGSGYQNIDWAFQIGFVGSLVLGLAHLLLADHDGRFDRRDGLGLLCGLGALMCSGVGVTTAVIVGLAMLLRRGWRFAALHTFPLGVAYIIWFFAYGRDAYGHPKASGAQEARFVATGIANGFQRLSQIPGLGIVLAAVLLAGLIMAVAGDLPASLRRSATPVAMGFGVIVFFLISGVGRAAALEVSFASQSRYAHLSVAFVLPALALGAEVLVRRVRILALPAIVVLLIGIPGNVGAIRTQRASGARPGLVLALAQVPAAARADRSLHPMDGQRGASQVTMGWLRDELAAGRLPRLKHIRPLDAADATFLIAVRIDKSGTRSGRCHPLERPVVRRVVRGGSVGFLGQVRVSGRTPDGAFSTTTVRGSFEPARIRNVYGPLILRISPVPGHLSLLCG